MLSRRDMSRAELLARLAAPRRAGGASAADTDDTDGLAAASPETQTHAPDEIAAALERLQALGLQSDSRFAESYVRGRQSRTGSRRLAAELRQKGVDAETIGAALADVGASDLQRARALWARRFELTRDPRERARQMRFLAARGFDMGVIRAVVGGSAGDEPPDQADDGPADDTAG
jgi:regulatory protein